MVATLLVSHNGFESMCCFLRGVFLNHVFAFARGRGYRYDVMAENTDTWWIHSHQKAIIGETGEKRTNGLGNDAADE